MDYLRRLLLLMIILTFSSCEMDGFLFNERQIDHYTLPGNTIPDSLLEEVVIQSEGNNLYGYLVKSANPLTSKTILYCHGYKHNLDEYWDRIVWLHELGSNIFVFDYRGFGLSEGESSEEGMYRDAEAALEFLQSRNLADSLTLYGYSLGSVASIYLGATRITPICLIAEAPFASVNSLTQGSTILDLPQNWLTDGRFDNTEMVKYIGTPFLLIHGTEDDFVRYRDNGRIVFENAPKPKSLVLVKGANHENIPEIFGIDNYLDLIRNWINRSQ